jgi:hypothetical protein
MVKIEDSPAVEPYVLDADLAATMAAAEARFAQYAPADDADLAARLAAAHAAFVQQAPAGDADLASRIAAAHAVFWQQQAPAGAPPIDAVRHFSARPLRNAVRHVSCRGGPWGVTACAHPTIPIR